MARIRRDEKLHTIVAKAWCIIAAMEDAFPHFDIEFLAPDVNQMNPGLREVFKYWQRLCGTNIIPSWTDFDWMELPSDVIPWCVVMDAVEEPLDFVYRFWGTARTQLQGTDYTGMSVSEVSPQSLSLKIFEEYKSVWETGKPAHFVTTDFSDINGQRFEYHFLRIPFGDDQQRVTQILGVGMHEEQDIKRIQNFFQPDG